MTEQSNRENLITQIATAEIEGFSAKDNALPLKKINIVIGPNNSGKSLLLRRLISLSHKKELKYKDQITAPENLKDSLNDFMTIALRARFEPHNDMRRQAEHSLKKIFEECTTEEYNQALDKTKIALAELKKLLTAKNGKTFESTHPYKGIFEKAPSLLEDVENLQNRQSAPWQYVPILRGLRPLSGVDDAPYFTRTKSDYQLEFNLEDSDRKLHTGENLFRDVRKKLLGEPEERESIREYESKLSEYFFSRQRISLIPKEGKDTLHVKIGDEKQRPIFELGDGLQTAIIISAAAYLEPTPSVFVIEEPETHLHPGFQRRLVEFLATLPHQYFFTTHSNHLLELAEARNDTNIFRIKKHSANSPTFDITLCGQDRELLLELGVNPASVYLANCTIWVEGITDRKYIRTFMQKYLQENPNQIDQNWIEGYHYTFVEYQGANLAHWHFDSDDKESEHMNARIATASIMLIADKDIESKRDRLKTLKEQLKVEELFVTPGKEIENLIPLSIIKETVKDIFNKKTKKAGIDISKIESLANPAYSADGIGRLIDQALGSEEFFGEESGTIKGKVEFCKRAVAIMNNNDDWALSPELNELCEKIFAHIEKYNRN